MPDVLQQRHLLLSAALSTVLVAAPLKLEAGPLTLEVSSSETAQLFHIVDQLSQWSQFNHKQYRRALTLDEGDEAVLKAHAALRQKLHYGALDQAFYPAASLDEALGKLKREEADVERAAMKRLGPKVLPFIKERQGQLDDYLKRLKAGELEALAVKADRFFGCGKVTLPAVLIVSTKGNGGGGVNGGVLTVEVGPDEDIGTLLHESWHALAKCKQPLMEDAAKRTGTTQETYSEGLAYAVYPGLFYRGADRLAEKVAADAAAHKSLDDAYTRFNRLGLAMRPTLKKALDEGQTFEQVLPLELAVFNGLRELERATQPAAVFCFGKPCQKPFLERLAQARDTNVWGRELVQLRAMREQIRPKDTVLLFPEGELSGEAQALLGDAWTAVAPKLKTDAGFARVDGAQAHVMMSWGEGALERVAASLGLDGGL